jgi:hypothetical protein
LVFQISKQPLGWLGIGFRGSERWHQSADGFRQEMQHPLRNSLAEREIIAREENVAQDNGESGEDYKAKETEDVLPD